MTDPLVENLGREVRRTARADEQTIKYRNCLVDHVTASAAADGGTAVWIQNGADIIPAPYLGNAPAAGVSVAVLFVDGSPLILGKPNGQPAL